MQSRLELALSYLAQGFSVIPLKPSSKEPAIEWKEYQSRLPKEQEVRKWFESNPDYNIGIVTGTVSGLVAVDVDPRNGGTIEGLDLPTTAIVKTGGGGTHHYYRCTEVVRSKDIREGVELKAEGRYVVAPGSIHPSGSAYEWSEDSSTANLGNLPEWVKTISRAPISGAVSSSVPELFDGVSEGCRNDSAARIAGWLLRHGVHEKALLPALKEWNETKNRAALPQGELEAVVDSIIRREASRVSSKEASPLRYETIDLDGLLSTSQPVKWLVEKLIATGSIGFIGGEPKAGKSMLALHLALSLSTGRPFLGKFNVPGPVRVLYVQEEDSGELTFERVTLPPFLGQRELPFFEGGVV